MSGSRLRGGTCEQSRQSIPNRWWPGMHAAHRGPTRSIAHVAVRLRAESPPGHASPTSHLQNVALRSPLPLITRESSSSDDQYPKLASGSASPPWHVAPSGHASQRRPPTRGHCRSHAPCSQTQCSSRVAPLMRAVSTGTRTVVVQGRRWHQRPQLRGGGGISSEAEVASKTTVRVPLRIPARAATRTRASPDPSPPPAGRAGGGRGQGCRPRARVARDEPKVRGRFLHAPPGDRGAAA